MATTPLLEYLFRHHFLDEPTHEMLSKMGSEQELRDSLIESGLMQSQELAKLESLLSALPVYPGELGTISPEILALVPFELARKYRMLAVDYSSDGLVLISDQNALDKEFFSLLG